MQIFQEVSSVQDATLAAGLITNKRAIESNVLVDDGQLVVLGGLIEERVEGSVSMVPGLGRLPIIGNLFRYDTRKRVKTNLLVFLRPVVLRTADSSYSLTADRYDYIRMLQGDARVTPSEIMPESQLRPPVLSPMPPRPGSAGAAPPGVSPAFNDAMVDRWKAVMPPAPGQPASTSAAPGLAPAQGPPGAAPGLAPASSGSPANPDVGADGRVMQTAPNEVIIQRNLSAPVSGSPSR
jgi:general secretion pathway protein D